MYAEPFTSGEASRSIRDAQQRSGCLDGLRLPLTPRFASLAPYSSLHPSLPKAQRSILLRPLQPVQLPLPPKLRADRSASPPPFRVSWHERFDRVAVPWGRDVGQMGGMIARFRTIARAFANFLGPLGRGPRPATFCLSDSPFHCVAAFPDGRSLKSIRPAT